MKHFLLVNIFIIVSLMSTAQINPLFIEQTARQADSLKIVAGQTGNDTIRMSALRDLTLYYLDINSDSALLYVKQELPIVEKLNLKIWKADAYDLYSIVLNNLGDYPASLQMINAAMEIAKDESCEKHIWHMYRFTGSADARNARLSMLAAIQLDKGGLYRATQDFDKQMAVHLECLKTASLINDYTIITIVQLNLGNSYRNKGQNDSAMYYYNESLRYSAKCGYRKYISSVFNGLAELHMRQNNLERARQELDSAFATSTELHNQTELGSYYSLMAKLLSSLNKPDSAILFGYRGLEVSKKSGRVRNIMEAYNVLAAVYHKQNRYDSAYKYLEAAGITKDSLNSLEKMKQFQNIGFDAQVKLQQLEKEQIQTQNKIRMYSMLSGLFVFVLIALILYRNNRQKQKANIVLGKTLSDLKSTQSQLIQSEKMASLGELTAGIAHEIQNPLNFVNNFSEVNSELIGEMKDELAKGNIEEAKTIANDIDENEQKIIFHGKRADSIVKGMLQHSRSSSGQKELTNINALADEYLRLAYHGLRAKDKSFNATMKTDFDKSIGNINIVPQDIGRVILNLITNAFYVVDEKKKSGIENYDPTVSVSTKKINGNVEIKVKDNGNGIPPKVLDKIFQPFFTTKPTGQGTGLGLSLSYDIVKAHNGELKVETKENVGTMFTMSIPAH